MLELTAIPHSGTLDNPTYRAFRFDKTGHIASAQLITASNDEQATDIAQTLSSQHGLELWERTRRLAHYPQHASDE